MIQVKKIGPMLWASDFSEAAHKGAFGEHKPKELDRIDYALLFIKDDNVVAYMTCRELDANSVYWQYGGVFEPFRGTDISKEVMDSFINYHKEHYKRCLCYIENNNAKALRNAVKMGFKIIGVRTFKEFVLLEHLLEFEEQNGNKIDVQ